MDNKYCPVKEKTRYMIANLVLADFNASKIITTKNGFYTIPEYYPFTNYYLYDLEEFKKFTNDILDNKSITWPIIASMISLLKNYVKKMKWINV